MSYGEHNEQVFNELEALIEKIDHGVIDLSFEVRNRKICIATTYGKKRLKYERGQTSQALQDLANRLQKGIENGATETITFNLKLHKGQILETIWLSDMQRKYVGNV